MKALYIISILLFVECTLLIGQDQKKCHDQSLKIGITREVLKKFDPELGGGSKAVIDWIKKDKAHINAVQNSATENKTLLMLAIELGNKEVIDYLLSNNVNTIPKSIGRIKGDALDFLIFFSGLKNKKENMAIAIKLVDLMIIQGITTEILLKRLAHLTKTLDDEKKRLKITIKENSFWISSKYKDLLGETQKSLDIVEAIIKHLAQKETEHRNSFKMKPNIEPQKK